MVYSFTKYVKDTAQYAFPYRDGNRIASIFRFHITCHTVSRTHRNATNCVVAQVLHNLYYDFLSIVCFMVMVDVDGVVDSWQMTSIEAHVYNWADDLHNFTNIITHRQMSPYLLQGISATNDFRNFVCNARLTQLVIFKA